MNSVDNIEEEFNSESNTMIIPYENVNKIAIDLDKNIELFRMFFLVVIVYFTSYLYIIS